MRCVFCQQETGAHLIALFYRRKSKKLAHPPPTESAREFAKSASLFLSLPVQANNIRSALFAVSLPCRCRLLEFYSVHRVSCFYGTQCASTPALRFMP